MRTSLPSTNLNAARGGSAALLMVGVTTSLGLALLYREADTCRNSSFADLALPSNAVNRIRIWVAMFQMGSGETNNLTDENKYFAFKSNKAIFF